MTSNSTSVSDDVFQAIEKTQAYLDITIGKLVPITKDMYPPVLEVVRECFIEDEPIDKALGLTWTKDFENIWIDTLDENLSFALVNTENGDIMGLRLIRKITPETDDWHDVSNAQDETFKKVLRILHTGTNQAQFFKKYNAKEAFLFLGLGVPKKYRRRGIATIMMKAGLKFLENLKHDSFYVRGGGTSEFSKIIFEKLGFETLAEIKYDTYSENGEFILRGKTGVHKSMKEYVLFINKDN